MRGINSKTRPVRRLITATTRVEGAGFTVRRPFPSDQLDGIDPFLLLDEMGPVDLAPGEAKGAPDHPHRGFETVTYVLEGGLQHADSQGHTGRIGPGDVQRMTAGAGVVHAEMPDATLMRRGGRMHAFQLWVNLPRQDKMTAPSYQELKAAEIPVTRMADGLGTVRVIAGSALGSIGPVATATSSLYLHVTLAPGGRLTLPLAPELRAFAYIFQGEARVGDELLVGAGKAVLFADDGDDVVISCPALAAAPVELLLLAGVPLRETVVRFGPFVMSSAAELFQAVEDYRAGRIG